MKQTFQVGDIVIYNDGRPGHVNVRGEVIAASPDGRFIAVQFDDRASPSNIDTSDLKWMKHLTKESK